MLVAQGIVTVRTAHTSCKKKEFHGSTSIAELSKNPRHEALGALTASPAKLQV